MSDKPKYNYDEWISNDFDYTFDDWIEETHLTFIRKCDEELDVVQLSLLLTNNAIKGRLEKIKDDDERYNDKIILIRMFAPIIMNYFMYKYYIGFKGTCPPKDDPINELDKLLGQSLSFKNSQAFLKAKYTNCGGC